MIWDLTAGPLLRGFDHFSGNATIRASESVSEQAMAFFMSNGCTVVWGMDLKWKILSLLSGC